MPFYKAEEQLKAAKNKEEKILLIATVIEIFASLTLI